MDMARFSLTGVEQQWSDVQAWEKRTNEYCTDIDDIMLKLGIDLQEPVTKNISNWHEITTDFQFIRMQHHIVRHRVEQISTAMSGLAGIVGNRKAQQDQEISLRETQRTKALTLVGLIFIPLAYTAALFSMNERYTPGAPQFWIYFAVSAPLVIVVILTYYILDQAYDENCRWRPQQVIRFLGKYRNDL
jgi:Mg2+ and Co2+ transporter CorA